MKMNFGFGLVLVIVGFISFLSILVYKSTKVNRDLVKNDYYLDDIKLNDQIIARRNADGLQKLNVFFNKPNQAVEINFGEGINPIGSILFQCPYEQKDDLLFNVASNKVTIPISKFKNGKWNVILKFVDGDKHYYFTKSLII
jgi:hypothetical protein